MPLTFLRFVDLCWAGKNEGSRFEARCARRPGLARRPCRVRPGDDEPARLARRGELAGGRGRPARPRAGHAGRGGIRQAQCGEQPALQGHRQEQRAGAAAVRRRGLRQGACRCGRQDAGRAAAQRRQLHAGGLPCLQFPFGGTGRLRRRLLAQCRRCPFARHFLFETDLSFVFRLRSRLRPRRPAAAGRRAGQGAGSGLPRHPPHHLGVLCPLQLHALRRHLCGGDLLHRRSDAPLPELPAGRPRRATLPARAQARRRHAAAGARKRPRGHHRATAEQIARVHLSQPGRPHSGFRPEPRRPRPRRLHRLCAPALSDRERTRLRQFAILQQLGQLRSHRPHAQRQPKGRDL